VTKALVAALLITVGLLIWSAYNLIDAGISLDHARQEQVHLNERVALLRSMLRHTTTQLGRSDLLRLLADDLAGDHIVKKSDDRVEIDDVIFTFRDDKVSNVLLLGEQ
jgi:hypothetical protein